MSLKDKWKAVGDSTAAKLLTNETCPWNKLSAVYCGTAASVVRKVAENHLRRCGNCGNILSA